MHRKKVARLHIILFFSICCNFLFPQAWTWDKQVTNRSGGKVLADKQHNWYAYDEDSASINKYNSSGVLLYTKTFQGLQIKNVVCTPDSGICIAGNFTTAVIVENVTVTAGGSGFIVIRYNSAGTLIWVKSGFARQWSRVGDIACSGNNIVLTGTAADTLFYGNGSIPKSVNPEMFVFLLDPTGGILDHTIAEVSGTQDVPAGQAKSSGLEIEADLYGNVYVFGFIHGKATIDTTAIGSAPYWCWNDLWVLKFDQGLNLVWDHFIDHTYYSKNTWHCLRVNKAGEAFLLVYYGSQYGDSHSQVKKISATGNNIYFYFNLPMNEGDYGWNRHFVDLQLDSCDNLYITGYVHGYYPLPQHSKYFLLNFQLSPQAQVLWKSLDSSDARRGGTSLSVLGPNHLLIAGNFRDSIMLQNGFAANYAQGSSTYSYNVGFFHARLQTVVGAPQNVTSSANQQVCENEVTVLTATANGIVSWYNSPVTNAVLASGFTFTPPLLGPGTYTYYADANSCTLTTARVPITFTVNAVPQLSVNNGFVCQGDTFVLLPSGAVSYTLSSGSVFVSPTITTLYYVIGSSYEGCTASAVCQVSVIPPPFITIHSSINYICAGEQVTLTASGAGTYSWSGGTVSATLATIPLSNTIYSVTGTDQHGCVNTATIMQYVTDCLGLPDYENGISVRPNPAAGDFFVTVSDAAMLIIYDGNGKLLRVYHIRPGDNEIRRDDLNAGCYTLRLIGADSVRTTKVILN